MTEDRDPYEHIPSMSTEELVNGAQEILGVKDMRELPSDKLVHMLTMSQYLTDICLNEIERRGELHVVDGTPTLPYRADHMVDTILTRPREAA